MLRRLGSVVLVSLLCSAYWAVLQEARAQAPLSPSPRIELEPAELDLGQTYLGKTAHGSFKIWNRGEAPLIISDIKRTCGCMVVALSKKQKAILPGECTTVEVGLKPAGNEHNAIFKKSVQVLSNDPRAPKVSYPVFTTLLLPIGVQPPRLAVENIEPGQTVTRKITLTCTTDQEFAITGLRLPEGPVSARFEAGIQAQTHEVELVIGPVGPEDLNAICTILTTHSRMKEVKVPLRLRVLRLVTVQPRMLMLGRVAPGTAVIKKIRLTPAPGHSIERADLEVERYPMIKASATKVPGDDSLWKVAFGIPIELAGQRIATQVRLTTNIENAGPLAFNINVLVDQSLDLGPGIPSGI